MSSRGKVLKNLTANADSLNMIPQPQPLPVRQNFRDVLWLFKSENQIPFKPKRRKPEFVANLINYLHFSDDRVLLHFSDPQESDHELVAAIPEPCRDGIFACRLEDAAILQSIPSAVPQHVLIEDGKQVLIAPVVLMSVDGDKMVLKLVGKAFLLGRRRRRRFRAAQVEIRLTAGGSTYCGMLLDFNRKAYHLELAGGDPDASAVEKPMTLTLQKQGCVLLESTCSLIRRWKRDGKTGLVVKLSSDTIERYRKRRVRNPRVHLDPPPAISFRHPISGKGVQIHTCEISSSGFSVRERRDEAVLVPGLIIPDARIHLPGTGPIRCKVQVIYEREDETPDVLCFGLCLLDIDLPGYTRLSQVICRSMDSHSFISEGADVEALWDFFFATGFIYPDKYAYIQSQREQFLETHQKLLTRNPDISKYFIFEEHGRILAHISLVHAYHRAWMVHHHAARTAENPRGGLTVLKHAMYFLNDMHRYPSLNIDYAVCYYRPDNRFPKQVFGGFAEALDDRQGCTQDQWTYMTLRKRPGDGDIPAGWELSPLSEADKRETDRWYQRKWGGLGIDALGVTKPRKASEELEKHYQNSGIGRRIECRALKRDGKLVAVCILHHADPGLNFSGFLNCIQVLVIREDMADWATLEKVTRSLMTGYEDYVLPVLTFPVSWAEKAGVPFDKKYVFWVLNLPSSGDRFMEFTNGKLKL